MTGDDREREQEEQQRVIISDKRHSRSDDDPADEPAPAEPELEVVEPGPAQAAKPEPPAEPETAAPSADAPAEPAAEAPPGPQAGAPDDELPQSAEMEQLKMIFDAGITSYLAGQVSMVINFALIYLGRAANPATGLVATDVKKAKTAIDTLEFISAQIKSELPEAEQQQLAGIVADLKYTFMQAAAGGPAPATPPGNGS